MLAVVAAEAVVAVGAVKGSEADAAVWAGDVFERRGRRGSQSVVAGEAVKAVGLTAHRRLHDDIYMGCDRGERCI